MKKFLSICVFLYLCFVQIDAQLYVNSYGKTILGNPNFSQGFFTVSTNTGQSQSQLAFLKAEESSCALEVCNFTPSNMLSGSMDLVGSRVFTGALSSRRNIGMQSSVYPSNSITNASIYGLLVSAGGGDGGNNYGICTSLYGMQCGTGIYASSGLYPDGVTLNWKYAGYFNGDVEVLGTLCATTLTQTSDYRLKENIRQLDNGSLDRLMNMNVVKYRFKNREINVQDSIARVHYAFDDDSPLLKTDHYGLIAQELKEIYPELVVEGENGYLSVNYIELIPILIKSVQELKAKVDELEANPDRAPIRESESTQLNQFAFPATLYQNNPNPFTENTIVKCLIPQEVASAVLYIYDMNGRQIDSMIINERGEISLTIEGGSLDAGIYLYSLITDGVVVDTKRMILTK